MMSTKRIAIIGVIVVLAIILLTIWSSYNSLVSAEQGVQEAWGNIEAQYQRRIDLIPNLVRTVESYAGFERNVLSDLTNLRTQWLANPNIENRVQTANQFESALKTIFAVAENYPDLKASQNFIALQDELAGTENRVALERTRYNGAVRQLNSLTKFFPSNIIAGWFGFKEVEYFEALTTGAETAPVVDINV
jgi:LemA protein